MLHTNLKNVEWARKIQSIAQIGLEYAENPYERERYEELRALSAEMMAEASDIPVAQWLGRFEKETGYEVRCSKLAAVLDRDLHYNDARHPFHIYKLMFLCEITGEADELCHDISAAQFFPLDDLPPLSLHRTLPKQIQLMYKHHQNPALPTVFD